MHADVNFSSVFVVINLQTWVLLLDYLGIGVPTPPPSRPATPDLRPPGNEPGKGVFPSSIQGSDTASKMASHELTNLIVDESLFNDLKDFQSLNASFSGAPTDSLQKNSDRYREDIRVTPGSKAVPDSSGDTPGVQSGSNPRTTGLDLSHRSSVWGVEGKLSLKCKLNVNSLMVTFNKQEHPLARGSVGGVNVEVKVAQGNLELSGELGQGSIMDMTETGAYYRERWSLHAIDEYSYYFACFICTFMNVLHTHVLNFLQNFRKE